MTNAVSAVKEMAKTNDVDILEDYRDEMMKVNPFLPKGFLLEMLKERKEELGLNIETRELSRIVGEPESKRELVPKDHTREYLLDKGGRTYAGEGTEQSLRNLLRDANRTHCISPLPDNELERVVAEIVNNDYGEVGQLMTEVDAEKVEWLWEGRLPLGKITILDGDPGLGKSALTTDLAARVSSGKPFPDGEQVEYLDTVEHLEGVGVVLMSAEDGLADTIRPRLDAAGADVSRILALSTVRDSKGRERILGFPKDLHVLEEAVRRVKAKLVIIDPFMAFLSPGINSNNDQEVRQAMTPIKEMAERLRISVLLIRHMNKDAAKKAIYRGGGSIGILGASRVALVVDKHPENDRMRVLAVNKVNVAEKAPSLTYSIHSAENEAAAVRWGATTEYGADDILTPPDESKLEAAKEWLRTTLVKEPLLADDAKGIAEKEGIATATLLRAKGELNVNVEKVRGIPHGPFAWSIADLIEDDHRRLGQLHLYKKAQKVESAA